MNKMLETLNTQAISLTSKGLYKEAIACFKKALLSEKNNYLLWLNLGLTYYYSGNYTSCRDCLLKAYELNPTEKDVLDTLAQAYLLLQEFDEAMLYCMEAIDLYPVDPSLWNTMGVINFNIADYPTASICFERAISYNPFYYDALYNLRDTYDQLGNTKGKNECIEKMKTLKDPSADYSGV